MSRAFRTAFVWVVMLTLSLSGYASEAMTLCGGMSMPASQSSHGTVGGGGIDWDVDAVLIASAQRSAAECGSMAASVDSSKSSTGNCTASAACGVATAPAPPALVFVAPAASAALLLPRTAPGFGFLTDAPDRPPRTLA